MRPTDALPRPIDWRTTTVRRSVELRRGVSWSKEQEYAEPAQDRMPVIGIKNVQSRLELNDLLYLSGLEHSDVEKGRISTDWTVLVGSNGNRDRIGNAVLINDDADFLFASFLVGAKPKADSGLRPDYFFRWLSYEQVQSSLSASAEGTTGLCNLSHSFLKNMSIPVPSPGEQAAISRVLDAVDTALERTRIAVDIARHLHHSLLHELLQRGISATLDRRSRYTKHWRIVRVDEVAEVGSGVTLGKDVSGQKTVNLPYLRVANVQDGHLDLTTVKTVRVPVDEVPKYRLELGDVLMTEGGDIDKLGRGTIWGGQVPECLHQNHVFRIRPKREFLEPAYFALVVESDIAKSYFGRVAKRTTNLGSTNKTQVRAFRFPMPPSTNEQQKIVEVMAQSKSLSQALVSKGNTLRQLKEALMEDLLTGKVRVADVSKGPAP